MKRILLYLFPLLLLPASASHSQSSAPPNILFMIADDLSACMGSYGNPVCKTPNLDRLAGAGVRFDRAYCQYPVCGPSRASLMSGLYPSRTGVLKNAKLPGSYRASNPQFANHPSMGGFFRENGYFVARVSKIYHMGVPGGIEAGEPGGDDPDSWDYAYNVLGPETFSPGTLELLSPLRKHYGSNFARLIVPDDFQETQADYLGTSQAIAILENRSGEITDRSNTTRLKPEAPFFLAVGFVRPHVPLIAPRRLFDLYPEHEIELPEVPEGDLDDVPEPAAAMENAGRYGMSALEQRQTIAAYYASVTFMDEQVGRLLDSLKRLGLRENTIVIFTSDHGYNLGEHHCWQKLSLFDESARVPLIISAPGFEHSAGQSSGAIVELLDLYPTLADLSGLAEKAPKILQGTSLRPLLEDPARDDWPRNASGAYTVTFQNGEAISTPRWRYHRWGNAGEELYDHANDPHEFTNQAGNPEHAQTLKEMRALMEKKRKENAG